MLNTQSKIKRSSWNKGKKLSLQHRKNLSNSLKGRVVWNKGTKGIMKPNQTSFKKGSRGFIGKHTEESKKKMSKSIKEGYLTGKIKLNRGCFKKGHIPAGMGKPLSEETKKKLSASLIKGYRSGEIVSWIKGRTHSQETRKKLSLSHKGKKPSTTGKTYEQIYGAEKAKEMKKNLSIIKKQQRPSSETRMKIRMAHIGEKSHLWKGGKTKLSKIIRCSMMYSEWRNNVFERDMYTCQRCNKKGCYLEAHHNKPLRDLLIENNIDTMEDAESCEELWDIDNGITLCLDCHSEVDKMRNRTKPKRRKNDNKPSKG